MNFCRVVKKRDEKAESKIIYEPIKKSTKSEKREKDRLRAKKNRDRKKKYTDELESK